MEEAITHREVWKNLARDMTLPLMSILLVGLAIRVVLIPLFSFDYDLSFWIATGQGLEGGRDIYETSYYWYTPIWGYILSISTGFGNLLGLSVPGELFTELITSTGAATIMNTTVTTISANVLYKMPLMIVDIVTAWVLYSIVKHMTNDTNKATIAFGLWFLCPLVIWSSSVACMFDSLSALFALVGFFFLIKGEYILSGPAFIIAVSSKFFPICLLFVILAYILSKHKDEIRTGLKNIGKFLSSGLAMLLVIYLPVILTGNLSRSFEFFYSRSESVSGSSLDIITMLRDISYNQILQFAPILVLVLILIGIWMYRSDAKSRDQNLIISIVMSFTVMFIWPPTPTYPVVMIPFLALAITVCCRKDLYWSWLLFSVIMTVAALSIFNLQLLYSIAAYTDLLDLGYLVETVRANEGLFMVLERAFRYLEFLPGISVVYFLYRHRKKNRIVSGGATSG